MSVTRQQIYRKYKQGRRIVLFTGDCLALLNEMPREQIDLVVTSPPYFMGKDYDRSKNINDFTRFHEEVLPEIYRVVRPGGSICWQVGSFVKDGVLTPLDYIVQSIFSKWEDLRLRNRIIWTFGHGLHSSRRFSGRHETILWYTKGSNYIFNLDDVRVPQKYPGKRHYKGSKRGQFSGNPNGKNPSDVWDIPNVKANHVEKTEHPCQFPVALAQRLIKALSPPHGVVLDPFLGAGSTAVASILEERSIVGCEIEKGYMEIAKARVQDALAKTIRVRSILKPILAVNGNSAVATSPPHFISLVPEPCAAGKWTTGLPLDSKKDS